MKKVLYKDVEHGQEYIYISKSGAWVVDAWHVKSEFMEAWIPFDHWVWIKA